MSINMPYVNSIRLRTEINARNVYMYLFKAGFME